MAEGDRLGALEVGEARHHGRRVGLGLGEKRLHQRRQLLVGPVMGVANPEADVDGDLIVAAASRMKPRRRIADDLASRLSTFIWMSSSAVEKVKAPASISPRTRWRP